MSKLRAWVQNGKTVGYWFYCPGCQHAHMMTTDHPTRHKWAFNGSEERPVFRPSLRVFLPARTSSDGVQKPEQTLCHLFIGEQSSEGWPHQRRGGEIEFLGDSTGHALRGWHPMPDFPEDYETP